LEDEKSYLHDHDEGSKVVVFEKKTGKPLKGPLPSDVVKKEMVRLGVKFGLVSKHTSFIAVKEKVDESGTSDTKDGGLDKEMKEGTEKTNKEEDEEDEDGFLPVYAEETAENLAFGTSLRYSSAGPPQAMACFSSAPAPQAFARRSAPMKKKSGGFGFSFGAPGAKPVMPMMVSMAAPSPRASMASMGSMDALAPGGGGAFVGSSVAYNSAYPSSACDEDMLLMEEEDTSLSSFILLQTFDGSFALQPLLDSVWISKKTTTPINKVEVLQKARGYLSSGSLKTVSDSVLEKVLGTILALRVLETLFKGDEDEWELVADKAKGWGKKAVGGDENVWSGLVGVVAGLQLF
jgi:hypothetical protein